jgi:death-on-curing family protein
MKIPVLDTNFITFDSETGTNYFGPKLAELFAIEFRKDDPDVRLQNPANLENVLELLRVRYNDKPSQKERIACKAGFLLQKLAAEAHPFVNGNKRMAYMLTNLFLNINGYEIPEATPMPEKDLEMVKYILEIASGKASLTKTIKWVLNKMEPMGVI